ncbi:sodium-coupled monocarboxylate transporter 1-like, partial [Saccoglossus kowalevskii]
GAITGVLAGFTIALLIIIGTMFYPPYWPQLPVSTEGCLAGNITTNSTEPSMISTTAASSLTGAEAGFAWFLNMSYQWYSPLELTVTLIVGVAVSFFT